MLLALDESRPVGCAIAHRDDRLGARLGTRALVLGALEAAAPAVLDALLDAVEARAVATGAEELVGPVQLLLDQSGGVSTAGIRIDEVSRVGLGLAMRVLLLLQHSGGRIRAIP